MKGHIRQRSKGSWTIVIDVGRDPATGKRRQHWHAVRGTKRDAERLLRDMLRNLEGGAYVKPTHLTLGEWLMQWFESYVKIHTTPITQESYISIIRRHIVPSLGAVPLTQLQPNHLQNYYAYASAHGRIDGKGGLSARSVL
jgi:integrase